GGEERHDRAELRASAAPRRASGGGGAGGGLRAPARRRGRRDPGGRAHRRGAGIAPGRKGRQGTPARAGAARRRPGAVHPVPSGGGAARDADRRLTAARSERDGPGSPGPFAFQSRYRSPSETERRHMARRSNPGGSSPSLNRDAVTAADPRREPANRRLTGHSSERPTWPPVRVRVSVPSSDQMSISGPAWTRTARPGPVRPKVTATSGATSNRSRASLRMAPTLLFSAIRSALASVAPTPTLSRPNRRSPRSPRLVGWCGRKAVGSASP